MVKRKFEKRKLQRSTLRTDLGLAPSSSTLPVDVQPLPAGSFLGLPGLRYMLSCADQLGCHNICICSPQPLCRSRVS